jgi:hypothetical protein
METATNAPAMVGGRKKTVIRTMSNHKGRFIECHLMFRCSDDSFTADFASDNIDEVAFVRRRGGKLDRSIAA